MSDGRFGKIVVGILLGLWALTTWVFAGYMIYAYIAHPDGSWDLLPHLCCDPEQRLPIMMHIVGACIMLLLGPFQLINAVKKTTIHPYTGILFVSGAIFAASGGILYMAYNDSIGGYRMTVPFTLYGAVLFVYTMAVVVTVVQRRFDLHKRWVVRLYLVATASVFYRVLYLFAFIIRGRWHVTFRDPIDIAFNWLFFIIPMLIAELGLFLYYRVRVPLCVNHKSGGFIVINPVEFPEEISIE